MRFISYHKKKLVFFTFIFCLFSVLFFGNFTADRLTNIVSRLVAPLQEITYEVVNWIDEQFIEYTTYETLEKQNEILMEENAALQKEIERLQNVEAENEKLTELLEMTTKYPEYTMEGAKIIAKNPTQWYDTFTIDKGSNDGIEVNMPVVGSEGVIGKVVSVTPDSAVVETIINPNSSVSAVNVRTEDIGYVNGDLTTMEEGYITMEYIDADANIAENDVIVTSNISTVYPPGLTIGYVESVEVDSNNLTKTAKIVPAEDFKHLEYVLVITDF